MNYPIVIEKMKNLLWLFDISQKELASKMCISQTLLSKMLAGKSSNEITKLELARIVSFIRGKAIIFNKRNIIIKLTQNQKILSVLLKLYNIVYKDLAISLNVHPSSITYWVNGKRSISNKSRQIPIIVKYIEENGNRSNASISKKIMEVVYVFKTEKSIIDYVLNDNNDISFIKPIPTKISYITEWNGNE